MFDQPIICCPHNDVLIYFLKFFASCLLQKKYRGKVMSRYFPIKCCFLLGKQSEVFLIIHISASFSHHVYHYYNG